LRGEFFFEPAEQIGWPFSGSSTFARRLARKSRGRSGNEGDGLPAADRKSALRSVGPRPLFTEKPARLVHNL